MSLMASLAAPATISAPAGAASSPARAAALVARFERVPFSAWHRRTRIVMGCATFFDAFDALALAFAMPILIKLWNLSPVDVGWLIAASYLGQLAGAIAFSRWAETVGRVRAVAVAVLLMSVMGLASTIAGGMAALFAFRLIQGIGVGGEMPVAATYISEMSRAEGRGRFFMLYELIFPIGLMATGQAGALLVPLLGWKTLFVIGAVPGIVVAVLVLRLPDTPRWLIGRGRLDEAEAIIAAAEASARRGGGVIETYAEPIDVAAAAPEPPRRERDRWLEPLSRTFRARTLVAWALWASAFFVANSLNNWMPTLYHTVYHLPLPAALRAASLTNVVQVVVLLGCAFLIDRVGRRRWAVGAFLIAAGLLTALAIGGAGSVVAVIVLATAAYGAVGSNNAVLYLYTPEIYPTRMRAIGTGLATSWLRLASAVGPAMVGLIVGGWGVRWVFVMLAGVSVLGALAASLMVETRNRALENIAA